MKSKNREIQLHFDKMKNEITSHTQKNQEEDYKSISINTKRTWHFLYQSKIFISRDYVPLKTGFQSIPLNILHELELNLLEMSFKMLFALTPQPKI